MEPIVDECQEETGESSSSDDAQSEAEIVAEWPCSTILHARGCIDEALLSFFTKYFEKNEGRIWQSSMNGDNDGCSEDDVVDIQFRNCDIAKDTKTLKRLFSMVDQTVETVVDKFVEKYQYFNLISTRDDYTLMRFRQDSFFSEHCECTGLDDDDTGAARRLCIVVFFTDTPEDGGSMEFVYQDVKVRANRGDVLVFPACPLHPNKTTPIKTGELIYAVNYIM